MPERITQPIHEAAPFLILAETMEVGKERVLPNLQATGIDDVHFFIKNNGVHVTQQPDGRESVVLMGYIVSPKLNERINASISQAP